MTRHRLAFAAALLILMAAATLPAAAQTPRRNAQEHALVAIQDLVAQQATRRGENPACFSYFVDAETATHVEITVRERHGGRCPGDPATSPIRDRYRVMLRGGTIQRYDPAAGVYVDGGR